MAVLWPLAATSAPVEFLYAEPNAGAAGGGHLALRLGQRVYHFQNVANRWLRIDRVHAGWFRYAYGVLQNRDLHVIPVELGSPALRALRRRLDRRFLVEQKHFEILEALGRDRQLFDRVAAERRDELADAEPLRLRGLGFFAEARSGGAALAPLQAQIAATYGENYLRREIADLDAALRALPLAAAELGTLELAPTRYLTVEALASERYRDLAQRRAALAAIARRAPLRPGAVRRVAGHRGRLRAAERAALEEFSNHLAARIVARLGSRAAQPGYPMLLALARLAALHGSLESDRWVVLDAYPDDASRLAGGARRHSGAFLAELEDYAENRFAAAREAWTNRAGVGERTYNDVEDAANRLIELRAGIARGGEIRASRNRLIPEGWGFAGSIPLPTGEGAEGTRPNGTDSDLASLRSAAREAERRFARALEALYAYQLVRRNCVTELLRETRGTAHDLDPAAGLHFVPAAAFRELRRAQPGRAHQHIPSYRTIRLAEMGKSEDSLTVFLRESNTITSSVYRRNPKDAWFLFFTDDRVWPRPLFGSANLVAGLLETAWGLVSLPVAGEKRLVSGVQGVVFSVPELALLNLRKGTLEYGPGVTPGDWPEATVR